MIQNNSPRFHALHVVVLTSFALGQPLFDRLSRNRVYLADQRIQPSAILALAFLVSVVVPALILMPQALAGWRSERARRRVHAVVVFLLVAATILPVLRYIEWIPGMIQVVLSLAVTALWLVAYRRFAITRLVVTAASPAIVIFPLVFLLRSPVAGKIFGREQAEADQLEVRNPTPVVLVVFDEFCGTSLMNEARVIDPIRYPHFAALARDGTWFRNATSVHPRTDNAVPAILTGNYPRPNRLPTIKNHPQNLFTLLRATKRYELTVFEPFTRLAPLSRASRLSSPAGSTSRPVQLPPRCRESTCTTSSHPICRSSCRTYREPGSE